MQEKYNDRFGVVKSVHFSHMHALNTDGPNTCHIECPLYTDASKVALVLLLFFSYIFLCIFRLFYNDGINFVSLFLALNVNVELLTCFYLVILALFSSFFEEIFEDFRLHMTSSCILFFSWSCYHHITLISKCYTI